VLWTLFIFLSTTFPTIAEPPIQWDLSDLYKNEGAWHLTFKEVSKDVTYLSTYQGSLDISSAHLLTALDVISSTKIKVARLYTYAALRRDENLQDASAKTIFGEATQLLTAFSQTTAYVTKEIQAIGYQKLAVFIQEEPKLNKHTFMINNIMRLQATPANTREEGYLDNSAQKHSFEQLVASIKWPAITLSSGEAAVLNQQGYLYYRTLSNRSDRKKAFDGHWRTLQPYLASLGETLQHTVLLHKAQAQNQGYNSPLARALAVNNIPMSVYNTLIEEAHANLGLLHKYLALKKRLLHVNTLQYYDLYAPLLDKEPKYTVSDAKLLTLASVAPLGAEYTAILNRGFAGKWMHATPQANKRSGAYMQDAAYEAHPYILLNFKGTYPDVITFSHEWGHAVHSIFSKQNNTYETAQYTPFTAELISITNELLLQNFMISTASTDKVRLFHLMKALDTYHHTFFRQALYAEFERLIHEVPLNNEQNTGTQFTRLYFSLLHQYYGQNVDILNIDPLYAAEWALMPHFYKDFYSYQYATGIVGGTVFAEKLTEGNTHAQQGFLSILNAGGSDYPHNILLRAGLDLTSNSPYGVLTARLKKLLNETEALLIKLENK